jgi:hypothetical protein
LEREIHDVGGRGANIRPPDAVALGISPVPIAIEVDGLAQRERLYSGPPCEFLARRAPACHDAARVIEDRIVEIQQQDSW